MKFLLGALGYVVLTFGLAPIWYFGVFETLYEELGAFSRPKPSFVLGFVTIAMQGLLLSSVYPRFRGDGNPVAEGLRFAAVAGVFLWTSQVVGAAAKYHMISVTTWLLIETAYFASNLHW